MRPIWATHLWPGLPQLWFHGHWGGLLLATIAALPINLLLLSWLIWTEWLAFSTQLLLLFVLCLCWTGSWKLSRTIRSLRADGAAAQEMEDLFLLAQSEYIKGNWFEAEAAIQRVIRKNARDVDAHLLLATLFRHSKRFDEATAQLRRITLFDDARKWSMEIDRERQLIAAAQVTEIDSKSEIEDTIEEITSTSELAEDSSESEPPLEDFPEQQLPKAA